MRFLAWHVDYVKARPTERGRSPIAEDPRAVDAENALFVFASFERNDEDNPEGVVEKAAAELESIAAQVKVRSVVLNPFAHLFGEPSRPEAAVEMLGRLQSRLADRGFEVQRLAFGMFYELELKAKGHRLARMARSIS